MKSMPKYTSRMFKPKMRRFGSESPRMPRMPRVKRMQEGGSADADDLVPRSMLPDENAAELAARARGSKGPPRRYRPKSRKEQLNIPPPPVGGESIVTPEAYEEQVRSDKASEAAAQREFQRRLEMIEQQRREEMRRREYEDYMARERPIMRARKGGSIKAYRSGGAVKSPASKRADGCAVKGKTRGKFV